MSDFIPSKDPQALLWMQAFANGIASSPPLYMLSGPDSVAISAAVHAFDVALTTATEPTTRTRVAVANKDGARVTATQICRQFAILIKFNSGISDADKLAIGVRPVNPGRVPVNVPGTSPLLNVIAATPGAQTIRYADSMTPDSGAKPPGATDLQLYVAIGTATTINPEDAQYYGRFTRNPIGVAFDPADNGKQATYFARWASRRGDVGPWSLPVTMAIAA